MVEVLNRIDNRINVNGVTGTYYANMLKQYVERQNMTSQRLMSIEKFAIVDKADKADVFSSEDCIFPSTYRTETYEDVSSSNELTPEQICEAESLVEQYQGVLTILPGRTDIIRHNIKLLTTDPVISKGYPIPYKTREVMETEIQEMLD